MKLHGIVVLCAVSLAMLSSAGCGREAERDARNDRSASPSSGQANRSGRGEALFRQFCSNCHPDGSNVSDPARNLHRSTLRAKGITRPEDIVGIIRNPISRMLRFDPATLPDEDARAIAEYVLESF